MTNSTKILHVAVPVPLAEGFDYLWTGPDAPPGPGSRVAVPFGPGDRVGVVLEQRVASAVPAGKLRAVRACLDAAPLLDTELLATLRWAADYYHHPIGEVVRQALPGLLRKGRPLVAAQPGWRLTTAGRAQQVAAAHARQRIVLAALRDCDCLATAELRRRGATRDALQRLARRGWIAPCTVADSPAPPAPDTAEVAPRLTDDQATALAVIADSPPGYAAFLLHGVTGSGKTEVFLRLAAGEVARSRQVLLLVPEIGLTPQLVARLRARFADALAVIHSGLTDTERGAAWRRAHSGEARLVVGTRSAVFAPLPAGGLIIVDEEHDTSYKQQDGFKYSARDLAVVRARKLGIPVLLASATPSLESLHNAAAGRYRLLTLPKRIGASTLPALRSIDLNLHAAQHGLSTPLIAAMGAHLERGNQVLLFLNRRGFAPALFCPTCAAVVGCDRCDARLTVHARLGVLRCHHCGHERPLRWACEICGSERLAVGAGTQRVSDALHGLFPGKRIARLDRDVATEHGALTTVLGEVESGHIDIIVGTQMLTKGHDFPRVTLVGILNADQGLFGTDFRSDERLAQTIVQVAGRAGRRDQPGEVVIQTHFPAHPLLAALMTRDYAAFAALALAEREAAGWPPFSHLVVWRAEAADRRRVYAFLDRLRAHAQPYAAAVTILGPAAAPMERRGGRYRAQIVMHGRARRPLHALVAATLAAVRAWPESRRVRWGIDVDPVEV